MKAYELTEDGLKPKGTICYPYRGCDYGLASDDTRMTGREHRSYTLKAFGGPPSFTHPIDGLREVEVPDIPPPDDAYTETVCKIGRGAECCRYLTMAPDGWSCEKLSPIGDDLDSRARGGEMSAQSDNCPGRAPRT